MPWLHIIAAGVAALVAFGLIWWRQTLLKEADVMVALPTTVAADVGRTPPGTQVEIKGKLVSAATIEADHSKAACVYHMSTIEEERQKSGSKDNDTEWREVRRNVRYAPVEIEDASGRAGVRLEDATIEGDDVVDRTERGGHGWGIYAKRYRETILRAGEDVYVLATVLDGGSLGADPAGRNAFIVSVKSEEARTKDNIDTAEWLLIIAMGLGAIGAGVLAWPFVMG